MGRRKASIALAGRTATLRDILKSLARDRVFRKVMHARLSTAYARRTEQVMWLVLRSTTSTSNRSNPSYIIIAWI